jgi:hypothetical protein
MRPVTLVQIVKPGSLSSLHSNDPTPTLSVELNEKVASVELVVAAGVAMRTGALGGCKSATHCPLPVSQYCPDEQLPGVQLEVDTDHGQVASTLTVPCQSMARTQKVCGPALTPGLWKEPPAEGAGGLTVPQVVAVVVSRPHSKRATPTLSVAEKSKRGADGAEGGQDVSVGLEGPAVSCRHVPCGPQ